MDNRALMSIILFCLSAYTLQTINVISASSNSIMFTGEAIPEEQRVDESLYTLPEAADVVPVRNETVAIEAELPAGEERSWWEQFVDRITGAVDWVASGIVWVGEQITGFFSEVYGSLTGGAGAVTGWLNTLWQIVSFDIFIGVPEGAIPLTIEALIRTLIAVPVNGLAILSIAQAVSSVVWGG